MGSAFASFLAWSFGDAGTIRVDVPAAFEVDISAHTPDERLTVLGHRWWTHDDLRHTDDWIWPHELVELWSLAGQPDKWPIDLGTQEESTVLDVG